MLKHPKANETENLNAGFVLLLYQVESYRSKLTNWIFSWVAIKLHRLYSSVIWVVLLLLLFDFWVLDLVL